MLAAQEGEHFHFLNHHATIKVRAGDHRSMSVVEFVGPRGFGPPLHSHTEEDELFVILDGELEFRTGDEAIRGEAGTCAYLPRAVPHTFQIMSDSARFMCVTASTTTIPRFDQMVAALGDSVGEPSLPEPSYVDPVRVADVNRGFGIDILGPPPAPIA